MKGQNEQRKPVRTTRRRPPTTERKGPKAPEVYGTPAPFGIPLAGYGVPGREA